MRVYIESTIPSYMVARPARDLRQAARRQATRDWWDICRGEHDLLTSQLALDEITAGEQVMVHLRLKLMDKISKFESTPSVELLADQILKTRLLLAKAENDAAHIALATVHTVDILLTWNCRHIAIPSILGWLRRFVERLNLTLPEIYTPEELLGD